MRLCADRRKLKVLTDIMQSALLLNRDIVKNDKT